MALDIFSRKRTREEHEATLGQRLPPGQRLTDGWPILHYGGIPRFDPSTWNFRIVGLVEQELSFSWEEFLALPQSTVHCDIHCVTHWSKFDNDFTGVKVTDVLSRVRINQEATFAMIHSYGGYTTNISVAELTDDDCLFAHSHNGKPLAPEHGYPLRLVVPKLYFWKSAKWVRGIEFIPNNRPGFWETYGYHIHGDPWKEERYS